MFKFLKRLFKRKPKYVVPNWEPFYQHRFPPIKFGKVFTPRKKKRVKQMKPIIPGGNRKPARSTRLGAGLRGVINN